MKELEKLHTLQFDLIKLILSKKVTSQNFKDLRENLILTNSLIESKKNNESISVENIDSIEEYVTGIQKGR